MSAWQEASESDRLYLILRGTLVFDEQDLPRTKANDQAATPEVTLVDAFFSGQQLGRNGFLRPVQQEVTLQVSCLGPWCAGALSDRDYVAFAEMRAGQLIIETNPCGGFLFPASNDIEEDLLRCMRGGHCPNP